MSLFFYPPWGVVERGADKGDRASFRIVIPGYSPFSEHEPPMPLSGHTTEVEPRIDDLPKKPMRPVLNADEAHFLLSTPRTGEPEQARRPERWAFKGLLRVLGSADPEDWLALARAIEASPDAIAPIPFPMLRPVCSVVREELTLATGHRVDSLEPIPPDEGTPVDAAAEELPVGSRFFLAPYGPVSILAEKTVTAEGHTEKCAVVELMSTVIEAKLRGESHVSYTGFPEGHQMTIGRTRLHRLPRRPLVPVWRARWLLAGLRAGGAPVPIKPPPMYLATTLARFSSSTDIRERTLLYRRILPPRDLSIGFAELKALSALKRQIVTELALVLGLSRDDLLAEIPEPAIA